MNYWRLAKLAPPLLLTLFLVVPEIANAQVYDWMMNALWAIISNFLGFFVYLAAFFLNAAVNLFVIGFGSVYLTTGLGQAIDSLWVLIRDVMNLLFIFGLLYIGINIILKSDDSRSRALLANLIIAALLVNFSLFFTKLVVDVSNEIGATIVLNGFPDSNLDAWSSGASNSILDRLDGKTVDIGSEFMNVLNVNAMLGGETVSFAFIFGAAIFFIISIFVFAAGALMLTIRFAALNLYLAFSPLMFIGWAFPPLAKYTSDYWRGFLKRAFFAPIYLLMLYFSLTVLANMNASLQISENNAQLTNAFPSTESGTEVVSNVQGTTQAALTVVPFFVLSCVFLIASLVIASKMGAEGATGAVNLGQRWSRNVGNYARRKTIRGTGAVALGGTSRVAQATAGGVSRRVANSKSLQRWAAKGGRNSAAGLALRGARVGADATYDIRNVAGIGKATGLGTSKGGYETKIKKAAEKDQKFYESLDTRDLDTPEAKAEVEALAAEKKAEAEGRKARAVSLKNQYEEDKFKSEEQLTSEIASLTTAIEGMEEQYEKEVASGTLTGEEKEARELQISKRKAERDAKQQILPAVKEIYAGQKEAAEFMQKATEARNQGNVEMAEFYEAKRDAALAERAEVRDTKAAQIKLQETKATEDINKANQDAANEVKYADRRAFEEQLEYKSRLSGFSAVEDKALELIRKKSGGGSIGPSDLQVDDIRKLQENLAASGLSMSEEQMETMLTDAMNQNRLKTVRDIAQKDKSSKDRKEIKELLKDLQKEDKKSSPKPEAPANDNKQDE